MSKYPINKINFPPTLRRGSKGGAVKWLQSLLGIAIDGSYGPQTETAVKAFQQAQGWRGGDADGKVGPMTWGALLRKAAHYRQFDPAWAKYPYHIKAGDDRTMRSSGCGPTVGAMIIATFCDPKVLPTHEADYAKANGYRVSSGTSHAYFDSIAQRYKLKLTRTQSIATVKAAIDRGALVIGNMGPGRFTSGGHFIVLWCRDPYSDIIYALDPGSSKAARTNAPSSLIAREAKRFFIFER